MWTDFRPFLNPSPIVDQHGFLTNPPKNHVDFQRTPPPYDSKIFANFRILSYSKNPSYNCSNGHTKNSFTCKFFLQPFFNLCAKNGSSQKVFVHLDKQLTPPSPHMDKHGFFGNPLPPLLSTWFMDAAQSLISISN